MSEHDEPQSLDAVLDEPDIPDHPVDLATGESVPDVPFSEFDIDRKIVEALLDQDIEFAFPIQALAIPDGLEGRDVLAKSKTGSGKTLAFGIPLIERTKPSSRRNGPAALVLAPTRELAVQVAEELRVIGKPMRLSIGLAYGGTSVKEQGATAGKADVLVATPGRLLDFAERGTVSLDSVKVCVLDEADRMLDMGFLPDVHRILGMLPEDRQTMLFSATLDGDIGRLAQRYTRDPVRHEIAEPTQLVANATHRFVPVDVGDKVSTMLSELGEERGLTLVFANTKRGADRLIDELRHAGVDAIAMHGDLSQSQREKALEKFASGKVRVLVATDVAARGLDLDDITHVVNFDPPLDDKSYVHRVGRTARAGRSGIAITLVLPEERADLSRMAARLQLHGEWKKAGMKVHPPRLVYTAPRSRNSLLGRQRRRKI
jgi:ATP-dependent RNA helicase RhlE